MDRKHGNIQSRQPFRRIRLFHPVRDERLVRDGHNRPLVIADIIAHLTDRLPDRVIPTPHIGYEKDHPDRCPPPDSALAVNRPLDWKPHFDLARSFQLLRYIQHWVPGFMSAVSPDKL